MMLFMMILLTKYQNCAPPPGVDSAAMSGDSSEVRIIDDFRSNKVILVSPEVVELADATSEHKVDGLCARASDDSLNWALVEDGSSAIVDGGSVPCERGGFRIRLHAVDQLGCGIKHRLEVESIDGDRDNLVVERRCSS